MKLPDVGTYWLRKPWNLEMNLRKWATAGCRFYPKTGQMVVDLAAGYQNESIDLYLPAERSSLCDVMEINEWKESGNVK